MSRAYAMVAIVLTVLAMVGAVAGNAAYTRHLQQQADRRWCDLLTSLDSPQAPATTSRGLVIQQRMRKLRVDLGCE